MGFTDILDLCEWINIVLTNIPKDGISRNTSVYTYRQTYRQTDRPTDRPADRLTDRQTDRHACLHACTPICASIMPRSEGNSRYSARPRPLFCPFNFAPPLKRVTADAKTTCIPLWSGDLILHHTYCFAILCICFNSLYLVLSGYSSSSPSHLHATCIYTLIQ